MRADGKPENLRRAMSWLHTWTGLLPGWLLYAVFFTGTLSYFLAEINTWMKPELHRSVAGAQMIPNALKKMEQLAPDASSWTLTLPGERQAGLTATWPKPVTPGENAPARGRGAFERVDLDATTAEPITTRATGGANFLYRFHFELHAIPRNWGRWIVGIATLLMFAAIISGVITHKKIFTEFFTFRPGKGARSWLDAHNLTAVLALPFHIMITLSGLLLIMSTLMPWGVEAVYKGDTQTYQNERRGGGGGGRGGNRAAPEQQAADDMAPLVDIAPILAEAAQQWPERGIGSITINAPGTSRASIEVREQGGRSLADRGASERLIFSGVTGELQNRSRPSADLPFTTTTYNVLTAAHLGRMASPSLRWLLFLSGVVGTLMIATGLVLWVIKRQPERRKLGYTPWGHRLAERLNVAAIAGLSLATAMLFWLNRILPADFAGRASWEIRGFFIVWLFTLVHAWWRPHHKAWVEQLWLASLLFLLLPLLNPLTGGAGLVWSLQNGQWLVAGFDLAAWVLAFIHGVAAWRMQRRASFSEGVRQP